MVARSSAQARSIPERIVKQAALLEEQGRALGRPATAMRDSAGNALVMNPDARFPLLHAEGLDSAVAYDDSTVRIMSPDTQEHRDLAARDLDIRAIAAAGGVTVAGTLDAGKSTVYMGTANASVTNTNGVNTSSAKVGAVPAPADQQIMTYDMTAIHNVLVKGNLYVNGQINPPSESALKHHRRQITDGLDKVRKLVPAEWTWRDPDQRDDRVHLGIYVDELAEVAPAAVHDRGTVWDIPGGMSFADKWAATEGRTYEDRAVIALLTSAVQTVADQRDALAERVDRLEQLLGLA